MQKLCFDPEKSEKRHRERVKNGFSFLFFALVEAFLEAVFVTDFLHFSMPFAFREAYLLTSCHNRMARSRAYSLS